MFTDLKNILFAQYQKLISSIAFYPAILTLGLFSFAFLMLFLEDQEFLKTLSEKWPSLIIQNPDTARSILSTLIGGIISLTVFSFSMVMVLLNQASSNFSPRLLPGLISDKRNQIVLGFYIGTIIYNILIMIAIEPGDQKAKFAGFSVLIGIVLGIFCLALFVFFIHSISTAIQINNILDNIFITSKNRILHLQDEERNQSTPIEIDESWSHVSSLKSGYFKGVNLVGLKEFAETHSCNIYIHPFKGKYILPHEKLISLSKELKEKQIKELMLLLLFSTSDSVDENFVLGIRQITEVGIKAMSPGINDPGTALITLDYITELLALRMGLDECEIYMSTDDQYKIELNVVKFEEILYETLAAYRLYCKHDIILMKKIILMLKYLKSQPCQHEFYQEKVNKQIEVVKVDIKANVENEGDYQVLCDLIG